MSALTAGKASHRKAYSYTNSKGRRVHVKATTVHLKSRRSRSASRRRHGGAPVQQHQPMYGGAADYFQDYAQVGGAAAPSFYDNYAAYADPRVAGAYDMYYDAVDPRVAGAYAADYAVDPRYGGAPLAPVDPYADWAQARYAGAEAYGYDQAPLVGGEFGMDALSAGTKAHKRSKPGQKKKTVKVHAFPTPKRHKSRSRKSKSRSRSRSHSRKHKRGGVVAAAPMMFQEPLVGGYYDPYQTALVGGFEPAALPLTGGKKGVRRSGHNKAYDHKSYNRFIPGRGYVKIAAKHTGRKASKKPKAKKAKKARSASKKPRSASKKPRSKSRKSAKKSSK
jgi:hypothetical protein